jgi:hypothetical protein
MRPQKRNFAVCVIVVLGAVIACRSYPTAVGKNDHGRTTDGGVSDAGLQGQATDAGVEPTVPTLAGFDAGVPLEQFQFGQALAFCDFWARCNSLAPYVVEDCIQAWTTYGAWGVPACQGQPAGCGDSLTISESDPGPLQAVDAGTMGYDPSQALACLQTEASEPCLAGSPLSDIAACQGVFYSLADAGSVDAGPVDVFSTCTADSDCTGDPDEPYCFDGYCMMYPRGGLFQQSDGFCPAFVGSGAACDSDPSFLGWSNVTPTAVCLPGLLCRGLSAAGPGTCAAGVDVGGSCVEEALEPGCRYGLACSNGTCVFPPSEGTCVGSTCLIGSAYCDVNTCRGYAQLGQPCSASLECLPELSCDYSNTNTCVNPGQ